MDWTVVWKKPRYAHHVSTGLRILCQGHRTLAVELGLLDWTHPPVHIGTAHLYPQRRQVVTACGHIFSVVLFRVTCQTVSGLEGVYQRECTYGDISAGFGGRRGGGVVETGCGWRGGGPKIHRWISNGGTNYLSQPSPQFHS